MGRLGGAELGYSSDADVMFVMDPLPGEDEAKAPAPGQRRRPPAARLLGRPTPDPPLEIDANLRPEGARAVGPHLSSFGGYWARTAAWERQALLRALRWPGTRNSGPTSSARTTLRYPEGGLSERDVVEIRRIKARVDAERLPRGADPTTHTKLGRGGLADVEWTIQLLQLQHAFEVPGLRVAADRRRARTPSGDARPAGRRSDRGAALGVGPGHPRPERDLPRARAGGATVAATRPRAGRRRPGVRVRAGHRSRAVPRRLPPHHPARPQCRGAGLLRPARRRLEVATPNG